MNLRANHRGSALIVVLIALVIMAFAAAAMLRGTDTATLIAGNLSFKKAAQASGDAGTEMAITWLNANNAFLATSNYSSGYSASIMDNQCDLTGQRTPSQAVNWDGNSTSCPITPVTLSSSAPGVADGYTVSYVINRICNAEGAASEDACSMLIGSGGLTSSNRDAASYSGNPIGAGEQPYYRITTRVLGPRGTVRYIQAYVVL